MANPWYATDYNVSAECKQGGSAQCDGADKIGRPCDCHCHETTEEGREPWPGRGYA